MKPVARRKLGGLLLLLSIVAVVLLFLTDVPLVTVSTQHFDATGATVYHLRPHWPLILTVVGFFGGLGILVTARRERVAR